MGLTMVNINYIQKGLLFRKPENQDFAIATFLQDLKDSLSVTLTHFHPLAARLATVKRQDPPSLILFLNPENSPGARFIHSTVDLRVSDVLEPTDVPLIVQSFFDHHKAIDHDGHELSLLSVQATELVDGIFIGASANHMVVDGTSFWHFLNSLSEVFRSKTQNGQFAPVSRPPVIERWIPPGSDPILTLPFAHEHEFIDIPNPPLLRERIFHFSADSLSKLKAKVNSEQGRIHPEPGFDSECSTTKISTLQALSAVMWRCVTRACWSPEDQETGCRLAINNRRRLSPPLPDEYLGNSVQTVRRDTTAGVLLGRSVGWAARLLHEMVANHGDKAIREFVGFWVKNPYVYKIGRMFDSNSIQMGSSLRFDMYGNEFGLGRGVAVLSGYANKFDGKVTLYPGRDGGGSIDLEKSFNHQPPIESPKLEIISHCFIKPQIISRESQEPIYISPWDLAMLNINYIQNGLLFRKPENQDFSIAAFLQDLKDSLSVTLTHFHPLAARLATVKQQDPPSLTIFLNPENSPGAGFIHSTVDLSVSDVLRPTDVPLIVQSFFDHHQDGAYDGHKMSLLSVQVSG
ncbi:hypothetical protein OSB04_005904 [Centaurea solstitialis]|uniref:Transferase n=1 Tax=Centaurea solstitialis TaxID=347529 RepID=A0AA38TGX8_9ASTR|nr:hypothetical protein OSB04_005904 [Centaurea solstitialis]